MNYSVYDNLFKSIHEAANIELSCNFFGTKKKVLVKDYYKNQKFYEENKEMVEKALKTFCSNKSLWSYLYTISEKWISEINNDPYFDGKKCESGADLIQAVKDDKKNQLDIFLQDENNNIVVYICGDYWLDDEHGFSVNFINGEFVKCKGSKVTYSDHRPTCTVLGQYDNAL